MGTKIEASPADELDKSSSSDGDAEHWVLCDGCHKWRRVTGVYAAELDDDTPWFCRQNPDKAYASCDIPQEMTNEQIDEEDSEIEIEADKDAKPIGRLPVVWQLLKYNVFSHRKRKIQHEDDIMICHCAPVWRGGDGCGPDCINRLLNIECVAGFCPCEEKCSNQMFSQRRYAKLEVKRAGAKGFGLFAAQDIKAGQFIIEYIGEVLDEDEYMRRKEHYIAVGQRHYYFMNVGNGEVIDAARKGNHARFINHSCEPNCETQKWVVQGELAIGLFALRDIPTGEELTFDYNFERYGDKPMRCYCNTRSCRRFIGGSQEVLGEDRIGEAYDVTNDMEPMMVTESEVDFMVEAILNRSIGISSEVPTHAMLRILRHMCQQRGIVWSPTFVESPSKSPQNQKHAQKPERTMLPPLKLVLPKGYNQLQNSIQLQGADMGITNQSIPNQGITTPKLMNQASQHQSSIQPPAGDAITTNHCIHIAKPTQKHAPLAKLRLAAPQAEKSVQPVQTELKLKLTVAVKQEPQERLEPPKPKDPKPEMAIPKEPPTPRELSTPSRPPAAAEPVQPVAASPLPAFRGPLKAAFKQMKQLWQQSLQTPPAAPKPWNAADQETTQDVCAVSPSLQSLQHQADILHQPEHSQVIPPATESTPTQHVQHDSGNGVVEDTVVAMDEDMHLEEREEREEGEEREERKVREHTDQVPVCENAAELLTESTAMSIDGDEADAPAEHVHTAASSPVQDTPKHKDTDVPIVRQEAQQHEPTDAHVAVSDTAKCDDTDNSIPDETTPPHGAADGDVCAHDGPHQQHVDEPLTEHEPCQHKTQDELTAPVIAKPARPDSTITSHTQILQPFPFETDFDLLSPAKPRRRLMRIVSNSAKIKKAEAEQLAKAELARVNAELAKVSCMGGDDSTYDARDSVQETTAAGATLATNKRPVVASSSMASASTMVAPALSNSGFSTSVGTVPRRGIPSASSPPHYSSAPRFSGSKSRRSDVARLLDTLSNSKGSLVEPSRGNVVKLLRMFNLCDIAIARPRTRPAGSSRAAADKAVPAGSHPKAPTSHAAAEPGQADAKGASELAGAACAQQQAAGENNKGQEGDGVRAAVGPGMGNADLDHSGNGLDHNQSRLLSHPSPSLVPIKHEDAWSENKLEQKGDGGVEVCIGQTLDHAPPAVPIQSPPGHVPHELGEPNAALHTTQPSDPHLTTSTSGTDDALVHAGACEGHDAHHNQQMNGVPATTTGTAAGSTMTAVGEISVDVAANLPGGNGDCALGRGVAAGSEVGKSGTDLQEAPHVESARVVQEDMGGPPEQDAQAMSARQSARMVDLSLLLDVVLKTTASSARREFIKCGILSQLQAVIGRNFSREYYVILKKILRVVESLPLTADDIYSTRSAHGTFADVLRSISQNVMDKDVRERATVLLRKFPTTAITDQQLLARVRQSKPQAPARSSRQRARRFDANFDASKGDHKAPAGKNENGPLTEKEHGHDIALPGAVPAVNVGNHPSSPKGKGRRSAGAPGSRNSPKSKTRQGARANGPGAARIGPPAFTAGTASAGPVGVPRNPTRPTKFSSVPPPAPSENQMAPKIVEGLEAPRPMDPHMTAEEVAGAIMRPRVLAPLMTPWARPDLMPRNRTGRTMRPMSLKAGVPPHLQGPLHTHAALASTSPAPHLTTAPAAGNGNAEGVVLQPPVANPALSFIPSVDHEDSSPTHAWSETNPLPWRQPAPSHLLPQTLQAPHPDLAPDAKRRRFEAADIQSTIPHGPIPTALIAPTVVYGPSTPTPLPTNSPLVDHPVHTNPAAHPMIHLAQLSASLLPDQKPQPALPRQMDPNFAPLFSTLRTTPEGVPPISPSLPPLPPEAPPESPPPPPPPPSLVPTPVGLQEIFATGVYGGWFPDCNGSADDQDGSSSPRYSYSPLSPVPTSGPPSPSPAPPSPIRTHSAQLAHTSNNIPTSSFAGFQPQKLLFSPSPTPQPHPHPTQHSSPSHLTKPPTPADLPMNPLHHNDGVPMDTSDPHDPHDPVSLYSHKPAPAPAVLPTAPLYVPASPLRHLPPPHVSGSFPPYVITSHTPSQMNSVHASIPSGLSNPASIIPIRSMSVQSDLNLYRPEHQLAGHIGPIDPASIPSPEMSAVTEDEQYEASAAAAQVADGEVSSTPQPFIHTVSQAPHGHPAVAQSLGTPMDIDHSAMMHPTPASARVLLQEHDGLIPAMPHTIAPAARISHGSNPITANPHPIIRNAHTALPAHELLSPSLFSPPSLPSSAPYPCLTSPLISPAPGAHHITTVPLRSTMYPSSGHADSFPHPSPSLPASVLPIPAPRENPYASHAVPAWQQQPPRTDLPTSDLFSHPSKANLDDALREQPPFSSSPPIRDATPSPASHWTIGKAGAGSHPNSHEHLTPTKLPPHSHPGTNHLPDPNHSTAAVSSQSPAFARTPVAGLPPTEPLAGGQSAGHAGTGAMPAGDPAASGAGGLTSYPNSWKDPGPEFEAFVTDTVRHRLGKYTQPDHPSRISKDDAANLFRKIRKEVIEKERTAWQERSRQNIFKPIERTKLESNIKEFVRVYIRRLHTHK